MKRGTGILIAAIMVLLCVYAAGAETVYDAFGNLFRTEEMIEGFSVPVPAEESGFRFRRGDGHYMTCKSADNAAANQIYIDYYVFDPLKEFAEDRDTAEAVYAAQHYEGNKDYQSKNLSLDGHLAQICVFRGRSDAGDQSIGILLYVRNNRMLQIRVYSEPQNGTSWKALPKVTLDDMKKLAEMVRYDPFGASARAEEGTFILLAKGGEDTLAAGKTIKLNAVFDNSEKVNKKEKNDTVRWTVKDRETGKTPKGITINQKGELSADKEIEGAMTVTVKAESTVFHTTAEMQVAVIPAMNSIAVEPTAIRMYIGTKTPVNVRAIPDPIIVPANGISWTASKKGIVEIIAGEENGTVGILPLKAGDTVITATEPGGKTARVSVTVLRSVDDIILSVNGKSTPGSTVAIRATIEPKTLWDTPLTWSVDAEQEIATIERGTMRISKDAPVGTVITVTCTAEGAAEPVVRTVQIEVTEK